jgi:signal peptide peptidase SppA
MRLTDYIQKSYWAMVPEKLDMINQVVFNHIHGISISDDIKAAMSERKSLENKGAYVTAGGVAVIPVEGVLAKKMNMMMAISGGTSTELLKEVIKLAYEDKDVKAIVLIFDTPGGTVDGTEAIADYIYANRGRKPVVAFASGLMASAGYWIGSAADMIITEQTGEVGSIGVIMAHYDYSKRDEMDGVKRTFIYSGQYKAAGNDSEPLSRETYDYLKAGTDYTYSLFVDAVARNRGVSAEKVLKDMADGRIFIGQQALDAGLVDELGSLDYAIEVAMLKAGKSKNILTTKFKEERFMLDKTKLENEAVTLKDLEGSFPELISQAKKEGAAGVDLETVKAEAAENERTRILGLASVQFGEEEGARLANVVNTGVTVDQFKAISAVSPAGKDTNKKSEMLDAIKKAGAENPGAGEQTQTGEKDFMMLVEDYQAQHKVSKAQAIQAVSGKNPQAHSTWIKSRQVH